MRRSLLFALASLPLAGASAPADESYTGHYTWAFELSRFEPCGGPRGETWWVMLPGDVVFRRDKLAAAQGIAPGTRTYARVTGRLGPRGMSGHLGQSTHYLVVTRVDTLQTSAPSDCATARRG